MLNQRNKAIAIIVGLLASTMILTQNCGSAGSRTFSESIEHDSVDDGLDDDLDLNKDPLEGLPQINALVYGKDTDERNYLAKKIAGYAAPGLSEIFSNWRRMSNGALYANGNITKETAYKFCFTGIDPVTGNWKAGVDDTGAALTNPGTSAKCYASASFTASSWIYMSATQRLRCPTNSGRYIGFISSLKFDNFIHQAVLTSSGTDDDSVSLIIAAKVDSAGSIHTLSAVRSHGDTHTGQAALGWAITYRKDGVLVKHYGEKSVGGVYKNGTGLADAKGWNGRMSLVRVERNGNNIKAQASVWGTAAANLSPSSLSNIELRLNDSANPELAIFQGPQSYGYATLSQAGAEFLNISFTTQTDEDYVYDLRDNKVYEQQSNGKYTLKAGADAFNMLGAPIKAGNNETQRLYHLKADKTFAPL